MNYKKTGMRGLWAAPDLGTRQGARRGRVRRFQVAGTWTWVPAKAPGEGGYDVFRWRAATPFSVGSVHTSYPPSAGAFADTQVIHTSY